jgi:rare lipoprotein A
MGSITGVQGAYRPMVFLTCRAAAGLRPSRARRGLQVAASAGLALVVANCGTATQKVAGQGSGVDPKYGVIASPRVVADGEAVPKGGGRELVGKPYTVAGKVYTPRENPNYSAVGVASWYGSAFHGRLTANGEVFDKFSVSVAHPTLPIPSYVRVTNLANRYSIVARVNDRGPYHGGRLIDVSQRVAEALDFRSVGTARVKVDYIGRASITGSDDTKLIATLRTDGGAATLQGYSSPIMLAKADPAAAAPGTYGTVATTTVRPAPRAVEPLFAGLFGSKPAAEPEAKPVQTASVEPAEEVEVEPAPVTSGKVARGVPLPPDRPFDLGTTGTPARAAAAAAGTATGTGTAGAAAVPLPPRRTAGLDQRRVAGLFYAEAEDPNARFVRSDPLALVTAQSFVPLRPSARGL